jgi:hypothetical protein
MIDGLIFSESVLTTRLLGATTRALDSITARKPFVKVVVIKRQT